MGQHSHYCLGSKDETSTSSLAMAPDLYHPCLLAVVTCKGRNVLGEWKCPRAKVSSFKVHSRFRTKGIRVCSS